jgi:hypothetical protein
MVLLLSLRQITPRRAERPSKQQLDRPSIDKRNGDGLFMGAFRWASWLCSWLLIDCRKSSLVHGRQGVNRI